MVENFELILIIFLIIITLVFLFFKGSTNSERLKILLERQDNLQKNIIDIIENNINKIDMKFEKSSSDQSNNLSIIKEKIGIIDKAQENITDLSGISKKHPLLALSFLIILFSLAGIPPLGGFFAKFYVFSSVIEQKMYSLAIIGLLTTVISAVYYLKIIKTIYFDENKLSFDLVNNKIVHLTIFISCTILLTFFLYPSLLNGIISSLFI